MLQSNLIVHIQIHNNSFYFLNCLNLEDFNETCVTHCFKKLEILSYRFSKHVVIVKIITIQKLKLTCLLTYPFVKNDNINATQDIKTPSKQTYNMCQVQAMQIDNPT